MKKSKKILFIFIGIILGLILIDSIQAIVFNNKPMLKTVNNINNGNLYQISKGFLVDNYVCTNGTIKTVFKWAYCVCCNEYIYVTLDKVSDVTIEDKGVSLKIKEGTLTDNDVTFILENKSDLEVYYGEGAKLEKEQDGKWYDLKLIKEVVIHTPLFRLFPGGQDEKYMSFWMYGKLTSGKYRVVKSISIWDDDKVVEDFYVAGEFTID